jgi:transposase
VSKNSLALQLKPDEQEVLEGWVRAHGTPQQVVKRCRIVLLAHEGNSDVEIAEELGLNRHTCRLWRERFMAEGVESLWEVAQGRGRKRQPGLAERIVKATLASKPAGQTHWSSRTMAKAQGVDASTVCRIWQEHGLQPHRQETFKLSRDPRFVPKLLDVVGCT